MLALSLFSCKKTLDVVPTNQVDASTSIKTPADAQIMINGIIRSMSSPITTEEISYSMAMQKVAI